MTTTQVGTDEANPIDITVDADGGAFMPTLGKELHAANPDEIYNVIMEFAQNLAGQRGSDVYFLIQLEDGSAPPRPVVVPPNGEAAALPSGPIPVAPSQAYSAAPQAQHASAEFPQPLAPQGYPSGQFPQQPQGHLTGQFPAQRAPQGYQQAPPSGQFAQQLPPGAQQQPQGYGTGQFPAQPGYPTGEFTGYNLPPQDYPDQAADPGGRHSKPSRAGKIKPSRVGVKKPSDRGYRKFLYENFKWNLGQSSVEIEEEQLRYLIEQNPGKFGYHIVMINLKGGVGKTTSSMMVAGMLKAVLGHRTVLAVDANPQTGTLIERVAESRRKFLVDPVTGESRIADIRDLLRDPDLVQRIPTDAGKSYELRINEACAREDLAQYMHTSSGLFDVLVGPTDPAAAHGLTDKEYNAAMELADRHYGLIVTDCGTDMTHPVTLAALRRADMVVFVTEPEQGSRVLAERAMTCLHDYPTDVDTRQPIADEFGEFHPFRELVQRSVVLLNQRSGGKPSYDTEQVRHELHQVLENYGATTRPQTGTDVLTPDDLLIRDLPHDKHLKEGGEIEYKLLQPPTQREAMRLVAAIAADFPHALRRNQERARRAAKAAAEKAAAAEKTTQDTSAAPPSATVPTPVESTPQAATAVLDEDRSDAPSGPITIPRRVPA